MAKNSKGNAASDQKQAANKSNELRDELGRYFDGKAEFNAIFPTIDVIVRDESALDVLASGGNKIYIAKSVINQLNKLKGDTSLAGYVSSAADQLTAHLLNPDCRVSIYDEVDATCLKALNNKDDDLSVIAAAKHFADSNREGFKRVKLVTSDSLINMIASSRARLVTIENYENLDLGAKNVELKRIEVIHGRDEIEVIKNGRIKRRFPYNEDFHGVLKEDEAVVCLSNYKDSSWHPNEDAEEAFLAIRNGDKMDVYSKSDFSLYGLTPMLKSRNSKKYNWGQAAAMIRLKDRRYDNYIIGGATGSGKSLLGAAAALERLDEFEKIVVICSLMPTGGVETVGFLKGSLEEKLAPREAVMRGCFEVLGKISKDPNNPLYMEYLEALKKDKVDSSGQLKSQESSIKKANKPKKKPTKESEQADRFSVLQTHDGNKPGGNDWLFNMLKNKGKLEFLPYEYTRGMTFHNTLVIVPDAQNYTKFDIKTIFTRIGDGSVLIVDGDSEQVDRIVRHYGITININGFVHAWNYMRERQETANISLTETIRSRLANDAEHNL